METLIITGESRDEIYQEIIPQIKALITKENYYISDLSNVCAVLKEAFNFFWIGFYLHYDGQTLSLENAQSNIASTQFTDEAPQSFIGDSLNDKTNEKLLLGPFQGPLACTSIAFGKGVCGAAWKERCSFLVPDVEAFPGHIACSSQSKSEVVIPLIASDGRFFGVLDVDSDQLNDFTDLDVRYLEEICAIISDRLA